MAHIGTFQANSTGFEGEVFMVPLTTKGVRIVKETTSPTAIRRLPATASLSGARKSARAGPRPPTTTATISASPSTLRD